MLATMCARTVTALVVGVVLTLPIGVRAAEAPSPQTLAEDVGPTFTAAGDRAGNAIVVVRVGVVSLGERGPGVVVLERDRGGPWRRTTLPGGADGRSFVTAATGDGAAAVAWRRDDPHTFSAIEATVRSIGTFGLCSASPARSFTACSTRRSPWPGTDGRSWHSRPVAPRRTGRRDRVAIATAPPGGAFRRPVTVSSSRAGAPSVGVDSAGRALVAWVRGSAIEPIRVTADGRPGRLRRFAARARPSHPIVAVAPRGHALIAWTSTAPGAAGESEIHLVRRIGPGPFGTPKTLATLPHNAFSLGLAATILDQGRPVVAWSQLMADAASPSAPSSHQGFAGTVWMATMTPSGRHVTTRRLSTGSDDLTGAPVLAASPDGVVAAWPHHLDNAHSGWQVATADLAARFGAPMTIGPPLFVEGDILGGQTAAFSARRGRWTVLWTKIMPMPAASGYRNDLMSVDVGRGAQAP